MPNPARRFSAHIKPTSHKPIAQGHSAPPTLDSMRALLLRHGVGLPDSAIEKLWRYHQFLRKHNSDLDLTRLIGFETIVERHYADCLIVRQKLGSPWPSPLVDIGSGAGFPGLMIKISSPATEIILSEPRPRRVAFLESAIKELGLKGITVFSHKFTSRSFNQPVNGAITRAFESIALTLPRLGSALNQGGKAIFMKGPSVDSELIERIPSDYKLIRDERYRIPNSTQDRAVIVFERDGIDLNP